MMPTLTPAEFAAKWRGVTTTEKASSQSHFIDLCRMLGEPTPHDADPTGEQYAFERHVSKAGGGEGFADVWKRDFFAWEYKGQRANLKAAYLQLLNYKDDLGNPPLLIVSDLDRIEIRTNFTGLSPVLTTITLDDLAADDPSKPLRLLRDAFTAPDELRPRIEQAQITEKAARHFAELAQALRSRGHDPDAVAHFLDRILFCLFAEDAGLLPKGIFTRLSMASHGKAEVFRQALSEMFAKMSDGGGLFGTEELDWFNGGLFDSNEALPLTGTEINTLLEVSRLNWALIEPAIFGTLFERGLDPDQRAQLGAHYTDRDAIWGLVEPVILRPLRREYVEMQTQVTQLLLSGRKVTKSTPRDQNPIAVFEAFLDRLRRVRVLDPACGSGNFLIISLWALKDLEFEAIQWGSLVLQRPMQVPQIGPEAVLGIEINPYAAELARVTIWIGEIQWMIRHGLGYRRDPILRRLDHIETRDALLDLSDGMEAREAEWPAAEFIVGNPPFLGNRLLRRVLGDEYAGALWSVFEDRLPHSSDFVSYWHEKARAQIANGNAKRAGLLATQGIRGQASRRVLERMNESGAIFFARSDDPWVLAGAAVHISFVGQDDGSERERQLDGRTVEAINGNLSSGLDLTSAVRLPENVGVAFMGIMSIGPFDVPSEDADRWLRLPNPHGRPNSDVLRRWVNGEDISGRSRDRWVIDFGDRTEQESSLYEAPFEYALRNVRPFRMRSSMAAAPWWKHWRQRPDMRRAMEGLSRYATTPLTSKHRLFVWLPSTTLASHALAVIVREDDFTFGILHSKVHELWARGTGTQLREVESGFRYTPSTTFETFPFPRPSGDQREKVGEAARRLVELRDGWLNPADVASADLEKRTLTILYNQSPTWLLNAHAEVDTAVIAAYGWPRDLSDQSILERLLKLNLERAGGGS
jgi:MmeI, DNA-methyltransferase domain/MmeI, helicase spacer domain/MmeI, N-terminal domain/MmeI, target recognition domain